MPLPMVRWVPIALSILQGKSEVPWSLCLSHGEWISAQPQLWAFTASTVPVLPLINLLLRSMPRVPFANEGPGLEVKWLCPHVPWCKRRTSFGSCGASVPPFFPPLGSAESLRIVESRLSQAQPCWHRGPDALLLCGAVLYLWDVLQHFWPLLLAVGKNKHYWDIAPWFLEVQTEQELSGWEPVC